MSKSDYLEVEVLKYCGGLSHAISGTITPFAALFTVAPSDAGGGTEVSTSGTGYARQSLAGKLAIQGGELVNTAPFTFTPTGASDPVVAYGLFTASSSGLFLRWELLDAAKPWTPGDPITFATGAFIARES